MLATRHKHWLTCSCNMLSWYACTLIYCCAHRFPLVWKRTENTWELFTRHVLDWVVSKLSHVRAEWNMFILFFSPLYRFKKNSNSQQVTGKFRELFLTPYYRSSFLAHLLEQTCQVMPDSNHLSGINYWFPLVFTSSSVMLINPILFKFICFYWCHPLPDVCVHTACCCSLVLLWKCHTHWTSLSSSSSMASLPGFPLDSSPSPMWTSNSTV